MQDRREGPVPADLQALNVGEIRPGDTVVASVAGQPPVVVVSVPDVEHDWLMVRTAAGDWAGKVSKLDWASFRRPLADWQVVLLGDAYELQQKMDKLLTQATAPHGALAVPMRELLTRQWWAMDALRQVLRERIAGFGAQS